MSRTLRASVIGIAGLLVGCPGVERHPEGVSLSGQWLSQITFLPRVSQWNSNRRPSYARPDGGPVVNVSYIDDSGGAFAPRSQYRDPNAPESLYSAEAALLVVPQDGATQGLSGTGPWGVARADLAAGALMLYSSLTQGYRCRECFSDHGSARVWAPELDFRPPLKETPADAHVGLVTRAFGRGAWEYMLLVVPRGEDPLQQRVQRVALGPGGDQKGRHIVTEMSFGEYVSYVRDSAPNRTGKFEKRKTPRPDVAAALSAAAGRPLGTPADIFEPLATFWRSFRYSLSEKHFKARHQGGPGRVQTSPLTSRQMAEQNALLRALKQRVVLDRQLRITRMEKMDRGAMRCVVEETIEEVDADWKSDQPKFKRMLSHLFEFEPDPLGWRLREVYEACLSCPERGDCEECKGVRRVRLNIADVRLRLNPRGGLAFCKPYEPRWPEPRHAESAALAWARERVDTWVDYTQALVPIWEEEDKQAQVLLAEPLWKAVLSSGDAAWKAGKNVHGLGGRVISVEGDQKEARAEVEVGYPVKDRRRLFLVFDGHRWGVDRIQTVCGACLGKKGDCTRCKGAGWQD